MATETGTDLIGMEDIERKILVIRGQKVMLDADLATLYEVPTKRLNEQVKRNGERFPIRYMFRLTEEETELLNQSHFATGSQKHRDPRFPPFAFTELGVAMLSSVLNSKPAIRVNMSILETFVRLREAIQTDERIRLELRRIDSVVTDHNDKINALFLLVDELAASPIGDEYSSRKIGFIQDDE